MAGLNKVMLIGRLGRDPEGRDLQNGGRVVNLRLATSETWRDKATGERREKTEWHTVVIWNEGLGKVAEEYLRKGSQVYIEGSLQTRKYQDRDGNDRYATEVVLERYRGALVLLGDSGDGEGGQRGNSYAKARSGDGHSSGGGAPSGYGDLDDDIPFAPEWRG
mgnify:CR=1 FL=1|jgi:single stranded DNA-binding protein (ssb)